MPVQEPTEIDLGSIPDDTETSEQISVFNAESTKSLKDFGRPQATLNRRNTLATDEIDEIASEVDSVSKAKFRWITSINKVKHLLKQKRASGIESDLSENLFDEHFDPKNLGQCSIPLVSTLSVALTRKKRQNLISSFDNSCQNEQLRKRAYLTTLTALVYPTSCTTPHELVMISAPKPAICEECKGPMWGLIKQGYKCKGCGVLVHDRCRDMLNEDCLQRAAERSAMKKSNKGSKKQSVKYTNQNEAVMKAIKKLMEDRIEKHPESFQIVKDSFANEKENYSDFLEKAQAAILSGTSQWSCTIKINVVSAQGLQAKDKNGTSDPYVTLQIGSGQRAKKFKTKTIFNNLNPTWDEEFEFECHSSTDKIKVRVWDEDDDWKSKMKQKIKSESDDFLGQTIIEAKLLSGEMDVWYQLEKRTDKSVVSGAIRLKITTKKSNDGNEKLDNYSYTEQYRCLHTMIFNHTTKDKNGAELLDVVAESPKGFRPFFQGESESLITEFSLRYGVEDIFQALCHFVCLSVRYRDQAVPYLLSQLLAHINRYFIEVKSKVGPASESNHEKSSQLQSLRKAHTSTANLRSRNLLAATKYDPDLFSKILDQLHNSIRIDLSMFRNVFPCTDKVRLHDLKYTIELLTSITFFKLKVLSSGTTISEQVVSECLKACMSSTYNFLFNNCEKLAAGENIEDSTSSIAKLKRKKSVGIGPSLNSLSFWMELARLVASVMTEMKTYKKYIASEIDVEIICSLELFQLLQSDIYEAMNDHTDQRNKEKELLEKGEIDRFAIKNQDFLSLLFRIKWLYRNFILTHENRMEDKMERDEFGVTTIDMGTGEPLQIEYAMYFDVFTTDWLEEMSATNLQFVASAIEKDRNCNFKVTNESVLHSNSVLDIFSVVNQNLDILKQLDMPIVDLTNKYVGLFCKNMATILISYADKLTEDFKIRLNSNSKDADKNETLCTMLNNVQQLRVQLEKVYTTIKEDSHSDHSETVLTDVQAFLNNRLEELCMLFGQNFEADLKKCIKVMKAILHKDGLERMDIFFFLKDREPDSYNPR